MSNHPHYILNQLDISKQCRKRGKLSMKRGKGKENTHTVKTNDGIEIKTENNSRTVYALLMSLPRIQFLASLHHTGSSLK